MSCYFLDADGFRHNSSKAWLLFDGIAGYWCWPRDDESCQQTEGGGGGTLLAPSLHRKDQPELTSASTIALRTKTLILFKWSARDSYLPHGCLEVWAAGQFRPPSPCSWKSGSFWQKTLKCLYLMHTYEHCCLLYDKSHISNDATTHLRLGVTGFKLQDCFPEKNPLKIF